MQQVSNQISGPLYTHVHALTLTYNWIENLGKKINKYINQLIKMFLFWGKNNLDYTLRVYSILWCSVPMSIQITVEWAVTKEKK